MKKKNITVPNKIETDEINTEYEMQLPEEESLSDVDEEGSENDEDFEESENGIQENEPLQKRKHEYDFSSSFTSKKRKREVKPPTAEEMIRLKETENLYQSNLFRLQIEEMISELKPRKTDRSAIKNWLQNFRQFLTQLEDCENILTKHHDHIDDVHLPLPKREWQIEDSIKFYKPVDVKIMGSYRNGTVLGPYFVLDMVIIIPKKYFHKSDCLNQKYHYKRALYLSKIASLIQKSELVSTNFQIKYWLKRGDPLKPVLLFRPQGRMTEFVEVALSVYPEDNPFKLNRLLPEKNNVRPEWLGCERSHGQLPPTPHYNMSILEDLVAEQNELLKLETFEGNQNLKDATILLSVWLQQRQLLKGFGAFNEDLLSMLVVYLVKKQKINNHMSSYQICRNIWLAFAQMDWKKQGISLTPEENQSLSCPLATFHKYFELVFVDCTGAYNLCYQLNRTIYFRVREEAEKAIKYLNDPSINGFQILFMINMPFLQQYDHYICFTDPRTIDETLAQSVVVEKLMDFNGHKLPMFIKLLSDLLIEGLGNRLNCLCIQPVTLPQWKINEQCSENSITDVLIFGLKLNPEHALNVIEKGPEANKDEAAKFREFWGDKCELRRFRDSTVCESVCWATNDASLIERRIIVKKIVNFLLEFKLKINKDQYNYVANQLQDLVVNQFNPKEKNEEASQAVHKTFENISQQLRDMTDLPLSIVSVRCISPVYRFTEVFPPLPITHSFNKKICMQTNRGIVFQNKNILASPFYVEPIDLVLQMAMSQKWPNDLKAGKRLIAAFNIVIASSLKKNCGLNCQVTTDHVVVHKDGYVLRLYLGYSKEIALLKQQISTEGVTFYRDTPESILLEKKFINLPKVTGALYGLSQTHSSYGYATCLAKRWINSHLFDDFHFPTIVVELLMARLYVHPQPYEIAVQPLIAFLRFLNYIATTNWHIEPVIVNFNNLLSREQVTDIEKSFQANRSTLPPIVLATPYDLVGTLWTRDAPTLPTLIRMSKLAANSLKMLEIFLTTSPSIDNLMKVFEPPLSSYDAVIILKKSMLPRRLQCNFFKWSTGGKISELPISDFDPAKLYLQELRDHYNEYALFFHDTYGGNVIGVVLKPTFLEATDFKICNVGPRIPSLSEGKISLLPSKKSLIQGFYILGAGIVEKVKLR